MSVKSIKVGKIGSFFYGVAGFISENLWGRLSSSIQLGTSALLAKFYHTKVSRFFIKPYCLWQYKDMNHYKKFSPGSGGTNYKTFQDFFTRNLLNPPMIESESVWPCEGYLCEIGKVQNLDLVKVKGETRHLRTVFGDASHRIPNDYFFSNVFLHNNNYHHIHAPVSGKITRIEHIPGELLLLRPWAYQKNPSLPALTNERVNVDIEDQNGKTWFLSIVGGPLVATINLPKKIKLGATVNISEKIASFAMGSTCCMASPIPPQNKTGDMVNMGDPIL